MAFTYNENKIVKIKSNAGSGIGSYSWKNNIARILREQNKSTDNNTLFNNLGNSLTVDPKVELLMTDDYPHITAGFEQPDLPIQKFLGGGQQSSGSVKDLAKNIIGGKGGINAAGIMQAIGTVYNTASALGNVVGGNGGTADTFQPWFTNVPAYPVSSLAGIEFSYTFKFHLGQYGLWNAKKEVVIPILNLVVPALPREISAMTVQAPFPTTIQLLADIIGNGIEDLFSGNTWNSIQEIASDTTGAYDEAGGGLGGIRSAANTVFQGIGDLLQSLIHESYNKYTYDVSFGTALTFKKCLVKKVDSSFSRETDEEGYPISGEVDITFHTMIPLAMSFTSPEQQAIRFGVDN